MTRKHRDGLGWELVRLTEEELDDLVEACDAGEEERAEEIVDGAYERLFGPHTH